MPNMLQKKTNLDDTLKEINPFPDRFDIVSKEKNRSLIIEWPKAHLISSGQKGYNSVYCEAKWNVNIKQSVI